MADRPLPLTEAAVIVGVSRPTLYRWMKRGEVASEKSPGGRVRIRESEARRIYAWLHGLEEENPKIPNQPSEFSVNPD